MKKKIILTALFLSICVLSTFASGTSMPWDDGLSTIQNALGGTTAKVIGVILIIGGGIAMAVTEGAAVKKLFWIVIGMGIALNAASFLTMLYGSSSGALII